MLCSAFARMSADCLVGGLSGGAVCCVCGFSALICSGAVDSGVSFGSWRGGSVGVVVVRRGRFCAGFGVGVHFPVFL